MSPRKTKKSILSQLVPLSSIQTHLVKDIRDLIEEARAHVAVAVNAGLTLLYWRIGKRIHAEILKGARADYGARIIVALGEQLGREFGRGFSDKSLRHMIRFAEAFPDQRIVSALLRQLSWTHFTQIIYIDDPLKRDFYAEMCRVEQWSTRTLEKKINSMLFERTALSRKPAKLAQKEMKLLRAEDQLTPDMVFRDPYLLDFLGLKDTFAEKDLEAAILREMESFILEIGVGFAFLERQKRITIDGQDYYIDLLFYHRLLRRLVAIELKIGEFKAEHKGQMELYLRWLDKYERKPDEAAPVGLILCAGKRHETIELLDLEKSGIKVSSYFTDLLPRKVLEQKLHEAVKLARASLGEGKRKKKQIKE
jgi:predicted nuclease of restriction endonuclease-like (RecB) superfamily